MVNEKNKKFVDEMKEIVVNYNGLIKAIETTQELTLFDCKYKNNGIEFNFKDNNSEDYINIFFERIEGKENTF